VAARGSSTLAVRATPRFASGGMTARTLSLSVRLGSNAVAMPVSMTVVGCFGPFEVPSCRTVPRNRARSASMRLRACGDGASAAGVPFDVSLSSDATLRVQVSFPAGQREGGEQGEHGDRARVSS
jgi:hypothetical protein